MLKMNQILDEKDPKVRKENTDVTFPMDKNDIKMIDEMLDYLYNSQLEDVAEKLNLRPGMGLAAPQVGINKNFFVVCHEEEPGVFQDYVLINPKIISNSEELIYAETGEGCLSVNREVEGIVPRYARITIAGQDINGNPLKIRAREELAIAFQHEYDHLQGILFYDHIDPKNPYKNMGKMRAI
mgnify:CR=1 FL=1